MENELSFSTRRRVFLIQMIYALMVNYENLLIKDDKSILAVVNSAATASRYKARVAKEANIDIQILLEVVRKLSITDDLILQNCNSGSLERLSKVVLSILRVGIYELKYAPHQYSVANIMRDYLNIAVAFEHDPESGFINSILDKAYSQS
jgi:transcription termination factor NusB